MKTFLFVTDSLAKLSTVLPFANAQTNQIGYETFCGVKHYKAPTQDYSGLVIS